MIISVVIIAITTAPQIISLFPEEVIISMCANAIVVVQSASWCSAWKRRALLLYGNEAPAALSLQIIALALSKLHGDFNFLCVGVRRRRRPLSARAFCSRHECARELIPWLFIREQNYDLSALDQME
jgi:hypothetical protein